MFNGWTKTLEEKDYDHIQREVGFLKSTLELLDKAHVRIDIGHPHRLWEYGMALNAFETVKKHWSSYRQTDLKVLEVGAGRSLLGPTLSYMYMAKVTELEPDRSNYEARVQANEFLSKNDRPEIKWYPLPLEGYTEKNKFDAVFCISVAEHLNAASERNLWSSLADRVVPGGLLFITVDIIPDPKKHYVFDNLRQQNFTTDYIFEKVNQLLALDGMEMLGEADYTYHGNQVHDYSFFSLALRKKD